jgi:hypothetical protein
MANNRVTLNHRDIEKVLKQQSMSQLRAVAERVLAIVGTEFYEIEEWVGESRARVTVRTKDDWKSRGHEAKHHDLIRALGQIGGEAPPNPNELIEYTSSRGVVSMRTRAEVANYTRGRNG